MGLFLSINFVFTKILSPSEILNLSESPLYKVIFGNENLKFHKGGSKKNFPEGSILLTISISNNDIFDFKIGLV